MTNNIEEMSKIIKNKLKVMLNKLQKVGGVNNPGYSQIPFSNRWESDILDVFNTFRSSLLDEFWFDPTITHQRNYRPCLFREDEDNVYIEIELPRIKKENIKVEIVKDGVKVTSKDEKVPFVRSFQDSRIDLTNQPEAKLEDGVLTITAKKKAELKPKEIQIK